MNRRPTYDDVGKRFIYRDGAGNVETGVCTSYTHKYLFIQFAGDKHSKACHWRQVERETT